MDLKPFEPLITAHREWLAGHGPAPRKAWNSLFRDQPLPALAEAAAREVLEEHGAEVHPNERPGKGGPDFLCKVKATSFIVECTDVSTEKATRVTGLPELLGGGPTHYKPLHSAILDKAEAKRDQLSGSTLPVMLAVSTFHFLASAVGISEAHAEYLLFGRQAAGPVDELSPWARREGFLFLRARSDGRPEPDFRFISAVLLLGLGAMERPRCALLHPDPNVEFRPEWLPGIRFCRLSEWPDGTAVEWTEAEQ